jgi:hypothetical protein
VLLVAVARAEREGERPQHVQISLVISPLIWIKQRGPRQKTEVDPLQLIQSSGPLTCGLSEPLSSTVTAEGPDLKKHGTTRTPVFQISSRCETRSDEMPCKSKIYLGVFGTSCRLCFCNGSARDLLSPFAYSTC